jgi:hypothetical protein
VSLSEAPYTFRAASNPICARIKSPLLDIGKAVAASPERTFSAKKTSREVSHRLDSAMTRVTNNLRLRMPNVQKTFQLPKPYDSKDFGEIHSQSPFVNILQILHDFTAFLCQLVPSNKPSGNHLIRKPIRSCFCATGMQQCVLALCLQILAGACCKQNWSRNPDCALSTLAFF